MKKKNFVVLLSVLFVVLTGGCANSPYSKGQQGAAGGAVVGALIGQAIGHNTAGTLIGAGVGTMLGYIVGNEMDKFDRQQLSFAYERTPSYQTSDWVNPDSRNRYAVTPQPAYRTRGNRICRKAEIKAVINGKQEKTYTTACRELNRQGEAVWVLQ